MWQKAMDEALEGLFAASMDGSVMIGRREGGKVQAVMEQTTCHLPGMLALGALHGAVDATKLWFFMDNAGKIMETCWRMYERTAAGKTCSDSPILARSSPEFITLFVKDLQLPSLCALVVLSEAPLGPAKSQSL